MPDYEQACQCCWERFLTRVLFLALQSCQHSSATELSISFFIARFKSVPYSQELRWKPSRSVFPQSICERFWIPHCLQQCSQNLSPLTLANQTFCPASSMILKTVWMLLQSSCLPDSKMKRLACMNFQLAGEISIEMKNMPIFPEFSVVYAKIPPYLTGGSPRIPSRHIVRSFTMYFLTDKLTDYPCHQHLAVETTSGAQRIDFVQPVPQTLSVLEHLVVFLQDWNQKSSHPGTIYEQSR